MNIKTHKYVTPIHSEYYTKSVKDISKNHPVLTTASTIAIVIVIIVVSLTHLILLQYQKINDHKVIEYHNESKETIELSILSYNILFQHYPHGIMNVLGLNKQPSDWELRRDSVKNIITKRNPDISCFQEARSDHPGLPFYSQNSDMRDCWVNFLPFGPPGYGTTGIYNPNTVKLIGDYINRVDYLGQKFITTEEGMIFYNSN